MTASAFLSAAQAKEAFEMFVLPSIMAAMERKQVKRPHLHVVTLEPYAPYYDHAPLPILFEYSVGDLSERESWDGQSFDTFARGKAHVSWRTGLPSREVVRTKPHLLLPGDCLLWGSAIVGGCITGVSGVEPCYDEMFATMTSAAMVGRASYFANLMAQDQNAPHFFPLL